MGQWRDEESGLWYNLHRYYDAGTGQYLSPDPLKLGGGINTQSYVHDPVGWCDPWGLAGTSSAEEIQSTSALRKAELLAKAERARDELVAQEIIKAQNRTGRQKGKGPATVTAGYNIKNGEVAAATNEGNGGRCAEDMVVEKLGVDKDDVQFTSAIRPRTGEQVPVCPRCEGTYGRDSFPPDATFKTDVTSHE